MKTEQHINYYTSILRSGNGVKGILLQAEVGTVSMSGKKIIAELPLVHDHRGITPRNWRAQLYKLANVPQVKAKRG
jgi:hypothetical protein